MVDESAQGYATFGYNGLYVLSTAHAVIAQNQPLSRSTSIRAIRRVRFWSQEPMSGYPGSAFPLSLLLIVLGALLATI